MKRNSLPMACIGLAILLMLSACTGSPSTPAPSSAAHPAVSAKPALSSAAPAPASAAPAPSAPKKEMQYLTIGTGNSGGTFYYVGAAIAQVVNKYESSWINAVAEASANMSANIPNTNKGDTDFAMAQMEAAVAAYTSNGDNLWGYEPCDNIRLVCGAYDQMIQVITRESSGIKTFADLKGKRLAYSSAAVVPHLTTVLKYHGVDFSKDFAETRQIPQSEEAAALKDGVVDAITYHSGIRWPALSNALPIWTTRSLSKPRRMRWTPCTRIIPIGGMTSPRPIPMRGRPRTWAALPAPHA